MDKGVDIYLRVDARVPFHWEAMGADGALDRFETARLLLWIDSLVEMMFARTGSGADIYDFRRAGSAWFEPYENVPKYDPLFVAKIVAELKRGYPVTMMIPGHQVVADGVRRGDYAPLACAALLREGHYRLYDYRETRWNDHADI